MARVTLLIVLCVVLFFIVVVAVTVTWLVLADAEREEQKRLEPSNRN